MAISIGIPAYNAELFLEDAICSVLVQTYKNWELIIIDDGSTDRTLEIARKFEKQDKRIRVISDGENRRLPARLNQIIQEAKYEYIARMDADDLIAVDRLEKQLNFLIEQESLDLVSTGILSINNNSKLIGYRYTSPHEVTVENAFKGHSGIIHASILARKSWYLRNRYNEDNQLAEDYELWLRAAINNDLKVGFIVEPLYFYREEDNVTAEKILKAYKNQLLSMENFKLKNINNTEFYKIVYKFYLKSIIVKILNNFGLMKLILKRRNKVPNTEIYDFYYKNLEIINKVKL